MDSLEFITRFRECMRQAGNRPVQVQINRSQTEKDITIRYEAAPSPTGYMKDITPPVIVITGPL